MQGSAERPPGPAPGEAATPAPRHGAGSAGGWRLAARRSLARRLSPFVFSFVVLSFCNPRTSRVSRQRPPLLLQTAAGRGASQAPAVAGTLPFRARSDTAGAPADSASPFMFLGFPLVTSTSLC